MNVHVEMILGPDEPDVPVEPGARLQRMAVGQAAHFPLPGKAATSALEQLASFALPPAGIGSSKHTELRYLLTLVAPADHLHGEPLVK